MIGKYISEVSIGNNFNNGISHNLRHNWHDGKCLFMNTNYKKATSWWKDLRHVRTTKPGWCRLKANRIYPGWNSGSTRPHSIRVDASSENLNSLGYFKTAKANDNTCACCQIIGILSATALEKCSWCTRTMRAILDPVSTHLNPHAYVGWLKPGSTRFRKKWVECGLAIFEFNPGWTRVCALVRTCL